MRRESFAKEGLPCGGAPLIDAAGEEDAYLALGRCVGLGGEDYAALGVGWRHGEMIFEV